MKIEEIISFYKQSTFLEEISSELLANQSVRVDLADSLQAVLLRCLFEVQHHPILVVTDKEHMPDFFDDFNTFGMADKVKLLYDSQDNQQQVFRTKAVQDLSRLEKGIYLTTTKALSEKVPSQRVYDKQKLQLKVREEVPYDIILDFLEEFEFERVDFVETPGQYAVRGFIIDIFSFGSQHPYRIVYEFDKIEQIKSFDIETQLSTRKVTDLNIYPSIKQEVEKVSLFEYLETDKVMWWIDKNAYLEVNEQVECLKKKELEALIIGQKKALWTGSKFAPKDLKQIPIQVSTHPPFNKSFKLLAEYIQQRKDELYQVNILFNSQKQLERFAEILVHKELEVNYALGSFSRGFEDHSNKLVFLTEHQILQRYRKSEMPTKLKTTRMALKEFSQLKVGDLVTHIDHGIGKFAGLHMVDIRGKQREAFKLKFAEGDFIYVSVHSLHKISKYNGKAEEQVQLHKLGNQKWLKTKTKVKSRVKKLAFDLVKLYAERRAAKGHSYALDTASMLELEASFMYEETLDQATAIEQVKVDMESPMPMDRLICGDVGFGKTEVAIRATYKAVCDGKQVAILVPTTVLAFQHAKSFQKRLAPLGCTLDYVSRMRTPNQRKAIAERLASGQVDVLIGTHQLLNPLFKFKDLGLLIIDEEQKFGVGVKEKLRTLKVSVDTLSMTATPIPRTLQMSLIGVKDMSIIRTAPVNRRPIDTHLVGFNIEVLKEALEMELGRGGQAFLIHNRVSNLEEVDRLVKTAVPQAKTRIAHGQLPAREIEQRVLGFMQGEYDVLICTTIVENGLDIPNANTILINNAHHFGLSELHQLRGRVGRSNRQAYCYLMVPSFDQITKEGRKRLEVLTQFTDPGAGFHISMKDLEIRGAGDVLGAEQSGFIADMGMETYQQLMKEAVLELKTETDLEGEWGDLPQSCTLEFADELFIPAEYIENPTERVRFYTQLSEVRAEPDLQKLARELEDKYGKLPEMMKQIFTGVRIKWKLEKLGVQKIKFLSAKVVCTIAHPDLLPNAIFQQWMNYINDNPKRTELLHKKDPDQKEYVEIVFLAIRDMETLYELLQSEMGQA